MPVVILPGERLAVLVQGIGEKTAWIIHNIFKEKTDQGNREKNERPFSAVDPAIPGIADPQLFRKAEKRGTKQS